jgi:hypothetical protein
MVQQATAVGNAVNNGGRVCRGHNRSEGSNLASRTPPNSWSIWARAQLSMATIKVLLHSPIIQISTQERSISTSDTISFVNASRMDSSTIGTSKLRIWLPTVSPRLYLATNTNASHNSWALGWLARVGVLKCERASPLRVICWKVLEGSRKFHNLGR